jgi:hypothetical protein
MDHPKRRGPWARYADANRNARSRLQGAPSTVHRPDQDRRSCGPRWVVAFAFDNFAMLSNAKHLARWKAKVITSGQILRLRPQDGQITDPLRVSPDTSESRRCRDLSDQTLSALRLLRRCSESGASAPSLKKVAKESRQRYAPQ